MGAPRPVLAMSEGRAAVVREGLGALVVVVLVTQLLGAAGLFLVAATDGRLGAVDLRASAELELSPPGDAEPVDALVAAVRAARPACDVEPRRTAAGTALWLRDDDRSGAIAAASDAARAAGYEVGAITLSNGLVTSLSRALSDPRAAESRGLLPALLLPMPLAMLVVGLRRRRRLGLEEAPRLPGVARASAAGLALGVAALLGSAAIDAGLGALGHTTTEQPLVADLLARGGAATALFVAFAVVLAPLGEEVFFRGFLFAMLDRARGAPWADVVSAALFAAVHLNPSATPQYLFLGLLLAWAYRRTGRLAVVVVAHAVHNALAIAL